MKKKSKSILAVVLAILLILVVAVSLTTNILFSRKDTPKIFGHYIYLMEYDTMEAGAAAVATGTTDLNAAGTVDSESAAASIHKHTAVIATAYQESDPIAKNNAVLCVLAPDDTSTDIDSDRVAVRRIYNIEQDETGVLKYYPTTMKTNDVGTEPPITVDSILGKCAYESGELYSYVTFATGVPGILTLLVPPSVILVIGVNGVGKTTSIGKLAHRLKNEGKKVLLCAGDTFRAAAADQLEIWAERAGVDIVRQNEGADPGAVLFDSLAAAKARNTDVVLCDTAGRLHNKDNLMKELAKLRKIIDREAPNAAKETLLVLDATTGQNGLIQARQFKETAGLTGIILTKLDGTAKGGIVIAIAQELQFVNDLI